MYKREVSIVVNLVAYGTRLSTMGTFTKPQQKKHYKLPIDTDGIKLNDIVRIDGLPFLTKPTIKNSKYCKPLIENEGYKAICLPSGYWVLRKE